MSLFRQTFLLIVLLTGITLSQAQSQLINLDEPVQGTLAPGDDRHRYQFNGTADTLLLIRVRAADPYGDLPFPQITFLSDEGFLADTAQHTGHAPGVTHQATLAIVLPEDRRYFIKISHHDRSPPDSQGDYILTLTEPETLQPDTRSRRTLSSDDDAHIFQVNSPHTVSLRYNRLTGMFYPEVRVHQIDANHDLHTLAYAGGDWLTQSELGSFPPGRYLVTVGSPRLTWLTDEFYFDPAEVTYTLSLLSDTRAIPVPDPNDNP